MGTHTVMEFAAMKEMVATKLQSEMILSNKVALLPLRKKLFSMWGLQDPHVLHLYHLLALPAIWNVLLVVSVVVIGARMVFVIDVRIYSLAICRHNILHVPY